MPTVNAMGAWLPLTPPIVQALMGYFQKRNVHCSTTIEGWHRFFSEMVRWGALEESISATGDGRFECLQQKKSYCG